MLTLLRNSNARTPIVLRIHLSDSSSFRAASVVVMLVLLSFVTTSATDWETLAKNADSLGNARQFDSAIVVGMQCLIAMDSSSDIHDTIRAHYLFEVGRYNQNSNRYDQADSLWQISLRLREKHFQDSHPAILNSLRYLSFIYLVRGQYAEAEALLKRSLDGWEQSRPQDTSFAVNMLTRRGVICMNQQRYSEAEEVYERALVLVTAMSEPEIKVSRALHLNLAYLYGQQKRFAKMEEMLLSLILVLEETEKTNSAYLGAACLNLAELYSELDRHGDAEVYLQKSLKQNELKHGLDSYPVAMVLTSQGNILMFQGKLVQASVAYKRALKIKKELAGINDRSVANTLIMYSQCEREQGNTERAIQLAAESFDIRRSCFISNYRALSEENAITYSQVMRGSANSFFTAFADRQTWDPSYVRTAANIILSTKGQVTDCMFDRKQSLSVSDDSAQLVLLDRCKLTAKSISGLYFKGPGSGDPEQYRKNMDSLMRESQKLEELLAIKGAGFHNSGDLREVSYEKIQALLPNNSVLIEYVECETPKLGDSVVLRNYFALVFSQGGDPVVINIGSAERVDSVVVEYCRNYDAVSRSWPEISEEQVENSHAINEKLYYYLIAPIEDYLNDKELVLIAPDGGLNLVSFAGLMDDAGNFLIEKCPIHYLSAGRDLIRLKDDIVPGVGLLAIGDPDYDVSLSERLLDTSTQQDSTANLEYSGSGNTRMGRGEFRGMKVSSLPWTRREVNRITRVWKTTWNEPGEIFCGADASEDRLKTEAPGKRVIHLATHGFFLQDTASSEYAEGEAGQYNESTIRNSLLKSGLFLAGANQRDQIVDRSDLDDGILTAFEVSAMNLQGTEWVVLSACESGLGEVKAGEGVWGLRRAFQMAGARTVISALWSIPDKQTVAIMEQLYSIDDNDLAQVMRQMAINEIEKIRKRGLPDHPYTWAAFVAVGDWRVNR